MSVCAEVEQILRSPHPSGHRWRDRGVAEHLDACPRCREVLREVGGPAPAPLGGKPADDPYATRLSDDDGAGRSDGFWLGAEALAPVGAEGRAGAGLDPRWPVVPGYELTAKLGEGGMGVVYRAVQQRLNRPVALKMIRGDGLIRAAQLERFRVEAEAVARLHHPNIVQIYEIGDVDGLPYFSLELLTGGGLDGKLAGDPQPARAAAEMVATLASAMHAAHLARIVHRDLKPANVVLAADGTPKLTDFGLAKRIEDDDASQTRTGEIMGSPCYMAPEQARGDNLAVGPGTDIYALGAILYEMLTGRPPFRGISAWDTVLQVIHRDPVPPSKLQPRVPRDLETICLKCLAKEPSGRYPSARHLDEDLRRYLAGLPILARPIPFWVRGAKWVRRRPAAAALVLVGLVASTGGVAGVVGARHRAAAALEAQRRSDEDLLIKLGDARSEAELHLDADPGRALGLLKSGRERVAARRRLGPFPRLDELGRRIDDLRRRAEAAVRRASDLKRFRRDLARFRERHDRALQHAIDPLGLESAGRAEEAGTVARQALEVFARWEPGANRWAPLPPEGGDAVPATDRTWIDHELFAMLVVLAEAEERRGPAADPRARAARGWEVLHSGAGLTQASSPIRSFHRRQAAYLLQMGRADEATREEAQADRCEPTAADSFLAGLAAFQNEELDDAIRLLLEARRKAPANFWAKGLLASGYQRRGDFKNARTFLDECIELRPDEPWLFILRGFVVGATGGGTPAPGEAEEDCRRAEALLREQADQPDLLRYALQNNWGLILLTAPDRLDEAAGRFRAATALAPDRPEARMGLAGVAWKCGDVEGTIEAATRAIDEASAGWPITEALSLRAAAHEALARRLRAEPGTTAARADRAAAAAIGDLNRAIGLAAGPSRAGLQVRLADGLRAVGRLAEAIALADEVLRADPGSFDALRSRVEATVAADPAGVEGQRSILRACDGYLAAARARHEPPARLAALYRYRAQFQVKLKHIPEAIDSYGLAIEWEASPGTRADTLVERGWVHLANATKGLALADFERAAALRPGDPAIHLALANAHAELGDEAMALDCVQRAERAGKQTHLTLFQAARVYALIDRNRSARAQSSRALGPPGGLSDQALKLLDRSFLAQSPAEQARFLQAVVGRDQAFARLSRQPEFVQMARRIVPDWRPAPASP